MLPAAAAAAPLSRSDPQSFFEQARGTIPAGLTFPAFSPASSEVLQHGTSMTPATLAALPTTLDYAALSQDELKERITRRKAELDAVILGHNYQRVEIQGVSDFLGDSLGLS